MAMRMVYVAVGLLAFAAAPCRIGRHIEMVARAHPASKLSVRSEPSFDSVCDEIVRSIRSGEFGALMLRQAEPRITLAHYVRPYAPSRFDSMPEGKTVARLGFPRHGDAYYLVTRSVSRTDLASDVKEFFQLARKSLVSGRTQAHSSMTEEIGELPEFAGPSVSGTAASNVDWAVLLRWDGTRWGIYELEVASH